MSLHDLAVAMLLFTAAVIVVVLVGGFAFRKWSKRERMKRGRQIAMAHLDPDCEEIAKDGHN